MPLLGEFVRRHPHILVDVSLGDDSVDVQGGQADVAIRFAPLRDSGLTARRLGENGRSVVASPDYLARRGTPQTPEDLLEHACLNFNFRRAEPVWPFRRDGIDFTLTLPSTLEANSGDTLGQLALDGVGVARLGDFFAEREIATGRLVRLLEPFNPGDREVFYAVFVGGPNMPARVRVLVDYLIERFSAPGRAPLDAATPAPERRGGPSGLG